MDQSDFGDPQFESCLCEINDITVDIFLFFLFILYNKRLN